MPDTGPIFRVPPVFNYLEIFGQLSESTDWGLEKARFPERWDETLGEGVAVCVLDTGVDLAHPDLKIEDAQDFTGGRNPRDRQRHGTHTAGTINMQHNGVLGRGGAPAAKLYAGKVLDDFGSGLEQYIVQGIRWARRVKADVLSMSFGSTQQSDAILAELLEYVKEGGVPVAAAGNDGLPQSNWPARADFVISVGACDSYGRAAPFSSWGDEVDIAAPGVDVVSTVPGGGLAKMSGTSMACPLVSAAVALMISWKAKNGKWTKGDPTNVEKALASLKGGAQKFPDPNTKRFGYGLIDAEAMLAMDDPAPVDPVTGMEPIEFPLPLLGFGIRSPARSGDVYGLYKLPS